MDSNICINDHSLGPSVRGCRGDFDFTLKFERIFLVIIPGAIFISLCLARLAYLLQQPQVVFSILFQFTKLVILRTMVPP
jgi:ATP-binding cassette, subfamily C (CFTR/MRP), member 1